LIICASIDSQVTVILSRIIDIRKLAWKEEIHVPRRVTENVRNLLELLVCDELERVFGQDWVDGPGVNDRRERGGVPGSQSLDTNK
jgi:hypothetical protein